MYLLHNKQAKDEYITKWNGTPSPAPALPPHAKHPVFSFIKTRATDALNSRVFLLSSLCVCYKTLRQGFIGLKYSFSANPLT